MRSAIAIAAITWAACKGGGGHDRSAPVSSGSAPAPPPAIDAATARATSIPPPPAATSAATLDPLPADQLPPPAPGTVRIASLDVDATAPADATVHGDGPAVTVETKGCSATIHMATPDEDLDAYVARLGKATIARRETFAGGWLVEYTTDDGLNHMLEVIGRAGATPYECNANLAVMPAGAACVEALCRGVRAVPGGVATHAPPAAPEVVDVIASAIGSEHVDRTEIYADGAVRFAGPRCDHYPGRTGKVDAARVTALVAALQALDTADAAGDRAPGPGCTVTGVSALVGGTMRTIQLDDCGGPTPAPFAAVLAWIRATVGANPCAG